ncbi:hypothetical protein K7L04_003520 [Vibrio parahaemolyticus]|nr:hypothetical protein [Vibrio parahaemolyticus]EJC6855345.1 hypothetical protein [Vibrio parahaemolyticus]EKN4540063.1 hypothetical protein [Vibrio parahaemolyticus]
MAIEKLNVERCESGFWTHPDLPDFGEVVDREQMEAFEAEHSIKVHMASMESEADEELVNEYFDGGSSCLQWQPSQPAENAFLLSIHDTEDGPYAWWAVPVVETPKQVLLDAWVAEYARLLITQCHFDLATAIDMGKAALENVDSDIDGYSPDEAVTDEIDAMRACC